MPRPFFDWPPFKLVALDADTGKPLDPNVGMRVCRDFYNVRKDKDGKRVMTRKSVDFKDQKGNVMIEDVKKGGKGSGDTGKRGREEKKDSSGDAQQASSDPPFYLPELEADRAQETRRCRLHSRRRQEANGNESGEQPLERHHRRIGPHKEGAQRPLRPLERLARRDRGR